MEYSIFAQDRLLAANFFASTQNSLTLRESTLQNVIKMSMPTEKKSKRVDVEDSQTERRLETLNFLEQNTIQEKKRRNTEIEFVRLVSFMFFYR